LGRTNNYLTVERYEEALTEAERCDQDRVAAQKEGRDLPWLHGIPISVKEQIEVKGTKLTVGCDFNAHQVVDQDAPIIR
jgi:amidase